MMGMAAVTDVVSSYFLGEPVVKADLVGISYDRTLREPERGTPGVHILTDIDLDLTPVSFVTAAFAVSSQCRFRRGSVPESDLSTIASAPSCS